MKYLLIGLLFGFGMANPATAQTAPTMQDGSWVMPTSAHQPEDAAFVGGSYEDMIYEVCANEGCAVGPDTMIRVMRCESGGDPTAVGPNGELGIFQIDPRYWGTMSDYQQVEFAAAHLGVDIFWACL